MYFNSSIRKHPETGILCDYFRLVESYRNGDNRICHRTYLNIGFMEDATAEQLNIIQKRLTEKYERKEPLFKPKKNGSFPLRNISLLVSKYDPIPVKKQKNKQLLERNSSNRQYSKSNYNNRYQYLR